MTGPDDLEDRVRASLARHADAVPASSRPFDPNRVTTLGDEAAGAGLAPTRAAGGRWARMVTVAAAAIVLAVVGLTAATQWGGTTDEVVQTAGNPTESTIEGPDSVSLESLNGLFVATSAEYNGPTSTNSWMSFSTQAYFAGLGRCLEDEGSRFVPRAEPSGPISGAPRNNTQFPDIAKLEAGTFVDAFSAGTSTRSAPGTTVGDGASATSTGPCDQTAVESYRRIAGEADDWMNRWDRQISGIDSDPAVATAKADYVTCMADRGIAVTVGSATGGVVEGDVFGLADEATRRGDAERVTQLARAYGTCFEPVAKAMDDYRLARRAEFYRVHATELRRLAVDIDRAEAQLRATYDIPRR